VEKQPPVQSSARELAHLLSVSDVEIEMSRREYVADSLSRSRIGYRPGIPEFHAPEKS
jgi:hypothetical protein